MTTEEAIEIREHLIEQLNINGFGDVVTEVNTRLREDYDEKEFERNPRYLLDFYLRESVDILENLSNSTSYSKIISRINEVITGEAKVEKISVELMNQGELAYSDLTDLPNYENIIEEFKSIINEISNEN